MAYGLTAQQVRLWDFIKEYMAEHRICPSYDEMKDGLGLASKSGVHRLILGLERRGHLRRLPDRARTIELIPRNVIICPHCGNNVGRAA